MASPVSKDFKRARKAIGSLFYQSILCRDYIPEAGKTIQRPCSVKPLTSDATLLIVDSMFLSFPNCFNSMYQKMTIEMSL